MWGGIDPASCYFYERTEMTMAYTNSKLVVYTKLSPNHSGARTHSIDRITPHCVVGQCTAEGLGDWFAKSSTKASSNYGIDRDGRVGMEFTGTVLLFPSPCFGFRLLRKQGDRHERTVPLFPDLKRQS